MKKAAITYLKSAATKPTIKINLLMFYKYS